MKRAIGAAMILVPVFAGASVAIGFKGAALALLASVGAVAWVIVAAALLASED